MNNKTILNFIYIVTYNLLASIIFTAEIHGLEFESIYKIQTIINKIDNNINIVNFSLKNQLAEIDNLTQLKLARKYLLAGNAQLAIDYVNNNLKNIKYNDYKNISLSNKIQFESYRLLKKYDEASNICLKELNLYYNNMNKFDDKWKMLCSYSFFQIANRGVLSPELKEKLNIWNVNLKNINKSNYSLLSNIYVSLAMRKFIKNKFDVINQLKISENNLKNKDIKYKKAYLIKAMMFYEIGKPDEAFRMLQNLVFKDNKNLVDNYFNMLSRIFIARLYASQGDYIASEMWYKEALSNRNKFIQDFHKNEVNNYIFEYAYNLYIQNKTKKSSNEFKYFIRENENSDSYKIKIAKIILYNILKKDDKYRIKIEKDIIKFHEVSKIDLSLLDLKINYKKNNFGSKSNKMLKLFSISKEYNFENKKLREFVENYILLNQITKNLEKNKLKYLSLLNNNIDLNKDFEKGINSYSVNEFKNNVVFIQYIFNKLDELTFSYWNKKISNYNILLDNRLNLVKIINKVLDNSLKIKLDNNNYEKIIELINKNNDICINSISKLYDINKIISYNNTDEEKELSSVLKNWELFLSINKKNNNLLNQILKSIQNKVNYISLNKKIIEENFEKNENELKKLKEISHNYNINNYKSILDELFLKISNFKGYIDLSLSNIEKYNYDNNNAKIINEKKIMNEKNVWLENQKNNLILEFY